MGLKGQTGASLGGGIVGRKQLKAQQQPELPPVDPDRLDPGARARRDAYRREQEAREAHAQEAAARREAARREERDRLARQGRRVMTASAATGRRWSDGR